MYTNKFSEHMFMRGDTMTEREIPWREVKDFSRCGEV